MFAMNMLMQMNILHILSYIYNVKFINIHGICLMFSHALLCVHDKFCPLHMILISMWFRNNDNSFTHISIYFDHVNIVLFKFCKQCKQCPFQFIWSLSLQTLCVIKSSFSSHFYAKFCGYKQIDKDTQKKFLLQ